MNRDTVAGGAVALVLGTAALVAVWTLPWWVTGSAMAVWIIRNEWLIRRSTTPPPQELPEGAEDVVTGQSYDVRWLGGASEGVGFIVYPRENERKKKGTSDERDA